MNEYIDGLHVVKILQDLSVVFDNPPTNYMYGLLVIKRGDKPYNYIILVDVFVCNSCWSLYCWKLVLKG
jgi:hypothetical protein